MRFLSMLFAAILLIFAVNIASAIDGQTGAGKMKIRFYTGNLSVGYFMDYWGTGKQLPGDVPTIDYCDKMNSVSVSSVTYYL